MSESKLTTAQRRVEQASEALNTLLEEGATPEQTTKARDTLAAAERELKKAQDAEKDRQAKLDAERRKEADAFAAELAAEIGAKMQEIIAGIVVPEGPHIGTDRAVAILKARSEAASAAETLTQAKARLDHLEARHSELSQQWDVISNRRAQGDSRDTDQGELIVIAADRDGIERLIETAQAAISRADLEHSRAAETLRLAERRWLGQVAETWRQGMLRAAVPLEAALTQLADEIKAHRGWNGEQRKAYEPIDQAFRRHLEVAGLSPYGKLHAA